MSALWTAAEAELATGGKAHGNWQVTGVSIDTRTLETGDLFVALTDVRDGHDFVAQALDKGAGAALVSRVPDGLAKDAPLLIVDNVLEGLEALGAAARARCAGKVIAVTGSVGKTTSKEMLRTALAGQGKVHAAVMSLNNHWGVPLTLARMPRDTDFAVIEIGMNHAGEIMPLSRLARPDVSIITTVAEAHMAAFKDVTDIARAKAEVFDGMQAGGVAILNRDISTVDILAKAAQARGLEIVTFGANQAADNRLDSVQQNGGVSVVSARLNDDPTLFKIGAPGKHLALNALAVLAAVRAVGADPVIAALDLAQWQPPQGRGQRHWIALDPLKDELRLELIDDAYNANPASMRAAFAVLADSVPIDGIGRIKKGRRVAFLSDMLELGEDEAARHVEIADLPSMEHIDIVHLAGPLMLHLHNALPAQKRGEYFATAGELAARAHSLLDAGDVAMVKGSKGSRASLVVDAILKLGQANSGQ
jgi:UDP-N-acetylmuramoyl-tripeptide--D-alanyl-D-alanine ligase